MPCNKAVATLPFTTICSNLSGTVNVTRRDSGLEPVGDFKLKQ